MNEITTFVNNQFGTIRTTIIDGEPWFVGKDVCDILGYSAARNAIARHVDNEDALKRCTPTLSGKQEMIFINESGLYALIFGSKLPSAKQFKRWVTCEVLPQIRKTGGYIPLSPTDDELAILSKAYQISQRTLKQKDDLLQSTTRQLLIAQPKADIYDKIINTKGYMSFNVVAKELGVGRNKLMALLRNKGILFRDGYSNIAYQKYCDCGYFVVKHSIGRNGYPCGVTKVTSKGLEFLYRIIFNEKVS